MTEEKRREGLDDLTSFLNVHDDGTLNEAENEEGDVAALTRSSLTKAKIYKERTKLRHVKIADLFPGYPSTARHRIFVNENLTAFRRSLIEAANKRRKD